MLGRGPAEVIRRLLLAGAAAAAVAAPAAAQTLVCCNIVIDVEGGWLGMARDCTATLAKLGPKQRALVCEQLEKTEAFCPDTEAYCPVACDPAAIERLKGRIRGLGDAARAHHKELNDTRLKRGEARDRLWGQGEGLKFEGGSISGFGKAMLDSLLIAGGSATRVGQAYGKASKAYGEVRDWTGTAWGLGSNPGDLESWSEFGQKMLDMQADAVFRQRSQEAIRAMNQQFKQTGNYVGAQNVYRQRWGGYGRLQDFKAAGERLDKVASGLSTLTELARKTDQVANDLQDWMGAYRDHKAAEREIARIEDEIDRLTRLRQRIEAACAKKPQAAALLLLAGPAPGDGYLLRVAAPRSPRAADGEAAVLRAAQQALSRLRALQRAEQEIDRSVGRMVFAPLSPWMAQTASDAQPRELLPHLVKESRGELERFGRLLEQLAAASDATLKALESIPPDTGQ